MIEEIRYKNFKCFEDKTVSFGPLTVLAGLNSSGKTSVIQAPLLLRQSDRYRLLPEVGLALNGPLATIGSAKDVLYEEASEDVVAFEVMDSEFADSAQFSFAYDVEADVLEQRSEETQIPTDFFSTALFDTEHFQYLSADRLGPNSEFPMSDFEVRRRRSVGPNGEFTAHFLSEYGRESIPIEALGHPDGVSSHLSDQVSAWLGTISPDVRIHTEQRRNIDQVELTYEFAGEGLGTRRRAANVGFGLTHVLPVVTAILASEPGSLVIIENPECNLHPRAQIEIARLASLAAAHDVQIVLETHSDHILNGVRLSVAKGDIEPGDVQLNYLEKRHEPELYHAISSPKINPNGRLSFWPEGFFDQWERSLEELMEIGSGGN
jgi:predicted ATPase